MAAGAAAAGHATVRPAKFRDERIDFFRGLILFIIVIEHMGGNWLVEAMPIRFGFTSGADVFVMCSGLASAFAFGGCFVKKGFWLGLVRIVQRIWQLYWAHISCFVATFVLTMALATWLDKPEYLAGMQQDLVLAHPQAMFTGLLTLQFMPPLLDILPTYMVVLALVPLVMLARRLSPVLPFILVGSIYIVTWTTGLAMPPNPVTGAPWLLNPFGWQLMFFTGFFIGMRWVRLPPLGHPMWMTLSVLFLLASVPLCWYVLYDQLPWTWPIRSALNVWDRTNFPITHFLHMLALAYVAVSLISARMGVLETGAARMVATVGKQTLPVFLASVPLAVLGGTALDVWGPTPLVVIGVTLASWAAIVAVAYTVAYVKSAPWTRVSDRVVPAKTSVLSQSAPDAAIAAAVWL